MTSRAELIRRKQLQINDADRKFTQVEATIAELEQVSSILGYDITVE